MCDVIQQIESAGVSLEQLEQVLKKRPGPIAGKYSAYSITLIVLGVVEREWAQRGPADRG